MKLIKLFSLALLGVSYNLQAQEAQNNGVVCEDKIIAGQVVKRCYYGTKPTRGAAPKPDFDVGEPVITPINPPPPVQAPVRPSPRGPINQEPGRVVQNERFDNNLQTRHAIILGGTNIASVSFNTWRTYNLPEFSQPIIRKKGGHLSLSTPAPVTGLPMPHKMVAVVSLSPGDFNSIVPGCYTESRTYYANIRFFTKTHGLPPPPSSETCLLEDNTIYYLNIRFTDVSGQTSSCDDAKCAALLDVSYS